MSSVSMLSSQRFISERPPGSVDEDTFRCMPEMIAGADLIDDDLPTNLDFLDQASRSTTQSIGAKRTTRESLRSWQADDVDDKLATEINGDTIRILMKESFQMAENYWNSLTIVDDEFADAWA